MGYLVHFCSASNRLTLFVSIAIQGTMFLRMAARRLGWHLAFGQGRVCRVQHRGGFGILWLLKHFESAPNYTSA
jgi:hypothetical protein